MPHTHWCYFCGIGSSSQSGLTPIAEGFAHPKCIDANRRSPANLEARIIALENEVMKMSSYLKRQASRREIDEQEWWI